MKLTKLTVFSSLALTVLTVPVLQAETISLEPTKDNTMFSEADESNGKGIYLFVGRTNSPSNRRALLNFDLSAAIPQGATVENVSLALTMNKTIVGAQSIAAHKLSRDWGEGASNAVAQEGKGTAAETGDVTWNHAFYPNDNWATVGGEYSGTSSATTSVDGNGTYTWSGGGMVADVQEWVDNPSTNFGWILIGPEGATSAKRFASRENASSANRPQLTITYSLQAPGWAGYPIESDGRSVDTGAWIGVIDIITDPWAYVYDLDDFVYAPEENISTQGAWIWIAR